MTMMKPIVYSHYEMSLAEKVMYTLAASAVLFGVGLLFYKPIGIAVIVSLVGLFVPSIVRKRKILKRKKILLDQFKHALFGLSSALAAGKSVENAFRELEDDMRLLYGDENTLIIRELAMINDKVENGQAIERAITDFAERANLGDIRQFADCFVICKRTGGNLIEVIRRSSTILADKLDIEQEIGVMLAQKRFEARALCIAPIALIAFLRLSSPEYMAPLYQGAGIAVMTSALIVFGFCVWMTTSIMNIQV